MEGVAELVPVLPAHRFDEEALAALPARRLPGFDGHLEIRQFQRRTEQPDVSPAHRRRRIRAA